MPVYVNMTDKFMSGWGKAKNGASYYCVTCDNPEQADAILKAAEDRPEMVRIEISDEPRRKYGCHTTIRHVSQLGGPWMTYMPPEQRLIMHGHEPVIQSRLELSPEKRALLEREVRCLVAKMKAGEDIFLHNWVGDGDLVPVKDGSWLFIPDWDERPASKKMFTQTNGG